MSKRENKPSLVINGPSYVIIPIEHQHGIAIPEADKQRLIQAMGNIDALFYEFDADPAALERFSKNSTERIVIDNATRNEIPSHPLKERRLERDLGQMLIDYELPLALLEFKLVYATVMAFETNPNFRQVSDYSFELHKEMKRLRKINFSAIDPNRCRRLYQEIDDFLVLNPEKKVAFNLLFMDVTDFIADVREYELWKPELEKAKSYANPGVVCGNYHVWFVKRTFEGPPIEKPNFKRHVEKENSERLSVRQTHGKEFPAIYGTVVPLLVDILSQSK